MNKDDDRRSYKRINLKFSITFTDWSSNNFHNATTRNCGLGGISFKTDIALKPGTDILIKSDGHRNENGSYYQLGSHSRAVVIWCKENLDVDSYGYVVGAQFYEPKNRCKDILLLAP